MKYKSIRGIEDILPSDVDVWRFIEEEARRELDFYGYEEIRTPILESTDIFVRGIGETTDIVTKEMYTFTDRKGRSLTLRPEGTAPIVRSYVEHALDKKTPRIKKFYYMGPMFRSERPQKGRSRQFHQIGVEVIGTYSPLCDTEVIWQLGKMLEGFDLRNFTIKLNSLGCKKDKADFTARLKEYLKDKKNRLCPDCKERIEKNVLRVLDCKKDPCMQVARSAPSMGDSLCSPCKKHFDTIKNHLKAMGTKFEESKHLVRGLDYYTGTVFEVTHPALGSQDAIAAGGRYDNLVKDFGGPDVGAVGYALGVERVILALRETKTLPEPITIYIATLGDKAKLKGYMLAEHLKSGLGLIKGRKPRVLSDIEGGALAAQMKMADKNNAKVTLIIGENELADKKVLLRNMVNKEQKLVGEACAKEVKDMLEGLC